MLVSSQKLVSVNELWLNGDKSESIILRTDVQLHRITYMIHVADCSPNVSLDLISRNVTFNSHLRCDKIVIRISSYLTHKLSISHIQSYTVGCSKVVSLVDYAMYRHTGHHSASSSACRICLLVSDSISSDSSSQFQGHAMPLSVVSLCVNFATVVRECPSVEQYMGTGGTLAVHMYIYCGYSSILLLPHILFAVAKFFIAFTHLAGYV